MSERLYGFHYRLQAHPPASLHFLAAFLAASSTAIARRYNLGEQERVAATRFNPN